MNLKVPLSSLRVFEAGDYLALHAALGLTPWEVSPLPMRITPLGVTQGPPPAWAKEGGGFDSWAQAQELQRLLQEARGR